MDDDIIKQWILQHCCKSLCEVFVNPKKYEDPEKEFEANYKVITGACYKVDVQYSLMLAKQFTECHLYGTPVIGANDNLMQINMLYNLALRRWRLYPNT